ncbi:MAG: winged helix-turn-helix domain-containing protein [Dehalococcoidales bacterium]|nr:winged helix-turn-helix domain-containing protein [Dehalococcoidales bacterium]
MTSSSGDAARRRKVLIVDAAETLATRLGSELESAGYQAYLVRTTPEMIETARAEQPDLVLLALTKTDAEGLAPLRELRALSDVPAIVVADEHREGDCLSCFELGADDYVPATRGAEQLLGDVETALARAEIPPPRSETVARLGEGVEVDFGNSNLYARQRHTKLRPVECRLLYHLVHNADKELPSAMLLAKVWGAAYRDAPQFLRQHITYLRQRIEADPANPRRILDVGEGAYLFRSF